MDSGGPVPLTQRDWRAVEAEEARFWAERKASLSAEALFALTDRFRAGLRELRPDWPSAAERAADLDQHIELAERLSRVRYLAHH